MFQFGRLYTVFGYDVYIGEVLLCAGVLFVFGGLTLLNKKITTTINFGMVALFIGIVIFVTLFCLIKQNGFSIQEVSFAPTGKNEFGQIMSVVAMSPWAFIGFESISHSTGSFTFKTKKVLSILLISLVASSIIYILLCLISVLAHPDVYESWYDYIAHNQEAGIMGIPPFFVAQYYMGQAGVVLFGIALFAIVATSIIGNIFALSNLVQRMAEDGIFPKPFTYVNKNDIPVYVRFLIIGLTFLAIFLGRAAIGFVVDVNNIGGVIVYTYVSACAIKMGKLKNEKLAIIFGILGVIASLVFGAAHIAPVFTSEEAFSKETFMVFVVFSLLGFLLFTFVLRNDTKGNFGNASIVWVGFSVMVTFFTGVWIIERSKTVHGNLLDQIKECYATMSGEELDQALKKLEESADYKNMIGMITLISIISMTLLILFLVLYFMKENEKKHKKQLETITVAANRDALTGVYNHRAYISKERRILAEVAKNPNYQYGIVVCDVNDLKYINDRYGHDFGDEYICKASDLIGKIFTPSPVFRIGGDEFAVILEGDTIPSKDRMVEELKKISDLNTDTETDVVIAVGMSTKKQKDGFNDVFRRADKQMYMHKAQLKKKRPSHYLR